VRPSKPAAKLFRVHRDRMALTPGWRGLFVTPTAIVDPEGNETPRSVLGNYKLMRQHFCEPALVTGHEQEIARWRRLLEAA